MKNDNFVAFFSTGFSVFPYIYFVPMAQKKAYYPILIVYFKDKVKGFLKRIPSYVMNAWFDDAWL